MAITPARQETQRIKDQKAIAELRLKGLSQQAIAERLGISQPTVCRDLKVIHQEWQDSAKEDIGCIVARELAKLDMMETELWNEWQRSKLESQKKVVEERPTAKGGTGKILRIETAGQTGDARYINALLGIQDRRAKLLGIDAPTKGVLNVGGTVTVQASEYDFDSMPTDALAELIRVRRNGSASTATH